MPSPKCILSTHASSPNKTRHCSIKPSKFASVAVSLYPGDADLRLRLAQIADDLGHTDLALQNYKITVQIEDGFREQFKVMYPDRKSVSRLEEDKYFFATQRINDLEQKPPR